MCWNGVLSADWKDAEIDYKTGVCACKNPLTRLSRMEKALYPNNERRTVSRLLPQVKTDTESIDDLDLLRISSIVDGTKVRGIGMVNGKTYNWKMAIESAVKSIAVVPDRFFDINGRSYSIDWNRKVSADSLPTYSNMKDAVIYRINTRSGFHVPPIATIIYDNEMQNRCGVEHTIKIDLDIDNKFYGKTVKLTTLLANKGLLFNGGYVVTESVITDINQDVSSEATLVDTYPISDAANKVHFLLCPPNRKIVVDAEGHVDGTTESTVEIRIFTLNDYGINKYLKNDSQQKVKEEDLTDTLVTYLQNHASTKLFNYTGNNTPETETVANNLNTFDDMADTYEPGEGDYLAIIVDALDNYHALIGKKQTTTITGGTAEDKFAQSTVTWTLPKTPVDVSQFKGIDMWLRFESINEMIYFLITKYEQDIVEIRAGHICPKGESKTGNWDVNRNVTNVTASTDKDDKAKEGRLWAYVNPRTMKPYLDDYWFHNGDPYYVKSLTLSQDGKKIKGNQIVVTESEWPGTYMVVGETYIRNRDTCEDERMQIKFPQVKVKADQTLTLTSDGEPTTFTINLEVAKPRNGHMMELTTYEVATKMVAGENGCYYAVDGSSEVVTE